MTYRGIADISLPENQAVALSVNFCTTVQVLLLRLIFDYQDIKNRGILVLSLNLCLSDTNRLRQFEAEVGCETFTRFELLLVMVQCPIDGTHGEEHTLVVMSTTWGCHF